MFINLKQDIKRIKDSLPIMVIEIILIFLSVLLAFSMGRWQDKMNKEEQVTQALKNIRAEIQQNCVEVEPLIEIHKNLITNAYNIPDSVIIGKSGWELFHHALEGENPQLPWVEKSAYKAAIYSRPLRQ